VKAKPARPWGIQDQRKISTDFLFVKIVGRGLIDRAKGVEFWDFGIDACKEFPK